MIETSESIAGKELFFSPEEYRGRLASVRLHMEQRGTDALLVHTPENILYLSLVQRDDGGDGNRPRGPHELRARAVREVIADRHGRFRVPRTVGRGR